MLLEQKKYAEAIEKFRQAIEVDPKYAAAYCNWGDALNQQERYEEAAEQYAKAVEVDPKYIDAYNSWGLMLLDEEKYAEAIEKFKQAIEVEPEYVYAYYNWGWTLISLKKYDQAITQFEKMIVKKPNDALGYNGLGLALLSCGRYTESEQKFLKAIEKNPSAPSAHYNLASLYGRLGKYRQSQKKWRDALTEFLKIKERQRTEYDLATIGGIYFYVFQEYDEARKIFESGLEKFPNSPDILFSLLDLYLDLKDKYIYEPADSIDKIAFIHWRAYDVFQKLKIILEEKKKQAETPSARLSACLDLGRLYKSMEEYEEAEKNLNQAIELDDSLADAYNYLGVIKTRREDYKGAIQDFKSAITREPNDTGIMSNLAEAYLKAKMLDQAEVEYRKVLRFAPSHIDSLIGLAETYVAMGDAAKDGSRVGDAEELYPQSINYYSKVIRFAEDNDTFTDASKKLTKKESSGVYYSRGYARVALHDAQTRKSDLLLVQAQKDFRKLSKFEADENFQKAKRAISKIRERLNPLSVQNIEQRIGPLLISFLAFVLFIASLFVFIKGKPEEIAPTFTLSDQALQVLQAAQISPEVQVSLGYLIGQEFTTREGLLSAIEMTVGVEDYASYEQIFLSLPLTSTPEIKWKPIEISFFVLMAFGSLIFMVAGFYLQQISRFKFAGIEIEKSSVSQISAPPSLGIRR